MHTWYPSDIDDRTVEASMSGADLPNGRITVYAFVLMSSPLELWAVLRDDGRVENLVWDGKPVHRREHEKNREPKARTHSPKS